MQLPKQCLQHFLASLAHKACGDWRREEEGVAGCVVFCFVLFLIASFVR